MPLKTLSAPQPAALVTGAAKRIGRAIARDLSANGFAVAIHAKNSFVEAQALAEEIQGAGGTACALQADLTDNDALPALMDAAIAEIGPLSLLVNNASIFEPDEIGVLETDLFDRHMALHARAPVFLAQAFAARLPEKNHGLIVNIIDQRVWKPTPSFFSYALSKSTLWSATRTMAQALAPRIRVNAIGPGPTLANERQSQQDFEKQASFVPLRKGPDLSEFGQTIRYLWNTPSITGQMIALDGGQHLAWETPDVLGITE